MLDGLPRVPHAPRLAGDGFTLGETHAVPNGTPNHFGFQTADLYREQSARSTGS